MTTLHRSDKKEMRTSHSRTDAKLPGLVAGGGQDSAPDPEGDTLEAGIGQLLAVCVEGISIDVNEGP